MINNPSGAQSLERAFALIDILAHSPEELPLQQITCISGLNKSTAHRILSALTSLGYVKSNDGKYSLTLKMLDIGSLVLGRLDITVIARPHLELLRDSTEETVHLVALDGCDIVYIQKLEYALNPYQTSSRIGMRRPAYCTAAGKSIMATMAEAKTEEIWNTSEIKPYTPNTITDYSVLCAELSESRQTMIAYDNEENEKGMFCVASPITDFSKSVNYAVSVSIPLVRMSREKNSALAQLVRNTAMRISQEMGYRPDSSNILSLNCDMQDEAKNRTAQG